MYAYLVYLTRDRSLAEDLAADTFEKALRLWQRFDPRRASARTWLCQIARTTALDWFRAEERRQRREQRAAVPERVDASFAEGLSPELEAALAQLSAGEREVIALRVLLELDGDEAARVLGVSPTAVSTRLSRALKKLEEKVSITCLSTLLNELRAAEARGAGRAARARARARAPGARARALSRPAPVHWSWRRLVLAAPATVVVALVAAGVIGLTRGDVAGRDGEAAPVARDASAAPHRPTRRRRRQPSADDARRPPAASDAAGDAVAARARPAAALRGRAAACASTTSTRSPTRRSARSGSRSRTAAASPRSSTTRPPRGSARRRSRCGSRPPRSQSALAELSQLGTILGQRYGIEDLQQQADTLQRRSRQTQRRIAGILRAAREPTLSDAEPRRPAVAPRERPRRARPACARRCSSTRAEASTATVYLTLTTEEIEPGAVGGEQARRRQGRARVGGDRAPLRSGRSSVRSSLVGFLVWLVSPPAPSARDRAPARAELGPEGVEGRLVERLGADVAPAAAAELDQERLLDVERRPAGRSPRAR